MKALLCKTWGPPGSLTLDDAPTPRPKAGEVRVSVHACGVNFMDTLIIAGKYQLRPELPFAPGAEVSGVVAEVGDGVADLRVGDRVMAFVTYGGLAEEVVLPASSAMRVPDGMDFVTAAAFPIAYGTSHLGLVHRAGLRAGETLLVLGAAGGVGLTAVEIGKKLGATVIAAASSAEKLAVARSRGADHLVDYAREDLKGRVKALGGADVVYDPVGGALFDAALRCVKWEGRLVVIGFASGAIPQIPANLLLVKNCSVMGLYWGAYKQHGPDVLAQSLRELLAWYAAGALRPLVSETFPLADGARALAALAERRATGKVVVTVR